MLGRLTGEMIENLLQQRMLGRLGCTDGKKTYVVPINFIYEDGVIYAHAVQGLKIEMMRKHPDVCFQVDEIIDFANWKSVVVWGKFEELIEGPERQKAMDLFVERSMRMKISETALPPELHAYRKHPRAEGAIKPVFYKIIPTEKTGRFERQEE